MVKKVFILLACLGFIATPLLRGHDDCNEQVKSQIQIHPDHPWRPPFGLDRIGQPLRVTANITAGHRLLREYSLVGYLKGKEVDRQLLHLRYKTPYFTDTASFQTYPPEFALYAKCTFRGQPIQLLRQVVQQPVIEADAIARPDRVINPVDLGTVLFPSDWLLLAKVSDFRWK